MTIETATYISDLNTSYPAAGDLKSEGDDHIRLLKSTAKTTFPNVAGAVNPTHTEFNYVVGVTSAIQTQINTKAPAASPVFTGQVSSPLGAVAAPTYTFTGDLNTGFWSPAADTVAISTGGSERARVISSGEVLVASTASFNAVYKTQVGDGSADTRALFNPTGFFAVCLRNGASTNGVFCIGASAAVSPDLVFSNGSGTERFRILDDGRVYGTALHNSAGAVTGTSFQYIASGTYTPTLTNGANVAASTAKACQWMRVGNVVTVSGAFDVDPTAAGGTATVIGISLPIASDLTLGEQLGGSGVDSSGSTAWWISGDAANNRAQFAAASQNSANQTVNFSFTYLVQ